MYKVCHGGYLIPLSATNRIRNEISLLHIRNWAYECPTLKTRILIKCHVKQKKKRFQHVLKNWESKWFDPCFENSHTDVLLVIAWLQESFPISFAAPSWRRPIYSIGRSCGDGNFLGPFRIFGSVPLSETGHSLSSFFQSIHFNFIHPRLKIHCHVTKIAIITLFINQEKICHERCANIPLAYVIARQASRKLHRKLSKGVR